MHEKKRRQPRNRPRPLTSSAIAPKISNFSYFFKPLQISETEKIGKFYLCVFQSFALAEKKVGIRCTVTVNLLRPSFSRSQTFSELHKPKFTTVFADTRLWKTKHPRKRFQNFRQSYVLYYRKI